MVRAHRVASPTPRSPSRGLPLAVSPRRGSVPGCGSTDRPLVFRGWARLTAFLYWGRITKYASYICRPCAEAETTRVVLRNTLLGWWSVPSFLWYGWRATYLNWRSIWHAPPNPGAWGAIGADDFAARVRNEQARALRDAPEDWLSGDSPLRYLTKAQQGMILDAVGLYELLGVDPDASLQMIRSAFHEQSSSGGGIELLRGRRLRRPSGN